MDPATKDWIDVISKIVGFVGVMTAVGMAGWQVRKARLERAEQARKDLDARTKNTKITQATFWLKLRRMFSDHNEVHFKLRPSGEWSQNPAATELPKVEAYMGLFEHCKKLLDDELLDLNTFKSIYAYRIENIIRNPVILFYKLMDRVVGWRDFVGLIAKVGMLPLLIEAERHYLKRDDARQWLASSNSDEWKRIMKEEFKVDVEALTARAVA